MAKMIFVNLPVSDLDKSTAFYEAVGATRNPQFSDETASCMVFSDTIHVMLLTHDKYRQFTPKPIANAHETSAMLIALSMDSREEVDRIADTAISSGGSEARDSQDHGFMYDRAFEDPDGHTWEAFYMDMEAAAKMFAEPEAA
jgi:predicted lactoylglutathione lyase